MTNFWNGKSIEYVVRDYLCASLDECKEGMQPINADGLVNRVCGNMTIKSNASVFVADYFEDAIKAIRDLKPDDTFRLSQYDLVVNLIMKKIAKDMLLSCETMEEYDETYHVWKKDDIERLKDDLEYLDLPTDFQRAVDINFESLESYSYRYLDYVLKDLEGKVVDLSNLASNLPMAKMSEENAIGFIRSNFNEAMRLLDDFRDSGYKVNYESPCEMIQCIMYQKQKEILAENPYLVDLVEYDGIKTTILYAKDIEELRDSLEKQQNNVKLSKFDELSTPQQTINPHVGVGRILDFRKSNNRCEVLY